MSHLTKIKVQIKNGEILHQVLQGMGYKLEYNAMVVDPLNPGRWDSAGSLGTMSVDAPMRPYLI